MMAALAEIKIKERSPDEWYVPSKTPCTYVSSMLHTENIFVRTSSGFQLHERIETYKY